MLFIESKYSVPNRGACERRTQGGQSKKLRLRVFAWLPGRLVVFVRPVPVCVPVCFGWLLLCLWSFAPFCLVVFLGCSPPFFVPPY